MGTDDLLNESADLERSLADIRDRQLADWVVSAVVLAAKQHPEALKRALASVYDLQAVEDQTKRVACLVQSTLDRAFEVRDLLKDIEDRIDKIGDQLEKVESWAEWLQKQYQQGYSKMRDFISRFNKWAKEKTA